MLARTRGVITLLLIPVALLFVTGCSPSDVQRVAAEVYNLQLSPSEAEAVSAHHVAQASRVDTLSQSGGSIPDQIRARWLDGGASAASAERAVRIAKCESRFNPKAQNRRSSAYGLFQFLDQTWRDVGIRKTSDVVLQIEAAFRLWKARGFQPWVCRG